MAFGRNRPKKFSVPPIYFLLAILLILSRFYPPAAHLQDKVIHFVLTPLFSLFHSSNKKEELSEVEKLKEENKQLKYKLSELEEIKINFDKLNALHHFIEKFSYPAEVARVISFDAIQGVKSVLINKGSQEGIKKGQAVIALEGVVGVVAKANSSDAIVLLLTEPSSAIDGEIRPSGARGLIHGQRKNLGLRREYWVTRMEYLGYSDELHEKDSVVTSGLDLIFPSGIPIGKVEKINRDEKGLFVSADLVTEVDFSKLSEVMVIKK